MFESCGGCCLSLILIPLLCCVLVAGAVIYVYTTAPQPPIQKNFQPAEYEAQGFDSAVTRARNDALTRGQFDLTFSERQFSSWLALRGQALADQHDRNFPFKDIQVGLDDGVMTFYAKLSERGVDLPVEIVITPGVNSKGQLTLDIKEAHMGGLAIPSFLLKTVTAQLRDALDQPFASLGNNYELFGQSLQVQNGMFTIQGRVRY